jgi:tetratricopeptide (TPR) repeat protein
MALACVLSLMLPAAALWQKTTNPEANVQQSITYNDRGLAKQKKGDFEGALGDFNQALRLNPNYALAYRSRGNGRHKKGDLDGAIADFNVPSSSVHNLLTS